MLTDVSGPSAPMITNLTCLNPTTIYLKWDRPRKVHKDIDFYIVSFRDESQWKFQELVIRRHEETDINGTKTISKGPDNEIILSNLTTNSMHELKVRGATLSLYNSTLIHEGQPCEAQRLKLKVNCHQVDDLHLGQEAIVGQHGVSSYVVGLEMSAGVIAGGVCVAFAVILALLALALWR